MGCCSSKTHDRAERYIVKDRAPYSWEKEERPDPKEYIFSKLKGETKVKLPGSILGQQFAITDCEDCTFFLCDTIAALTIDDCKNCKIFVGPVESSLMIRDCTACTFVAYCRQFRARDCHSCDCILFCRTQPIIESSTKMGIGCNHFSYKGLSDQLQALKISPFHNFWSRIHDYSPAPLNWHYLPQETTVASSMGEFPQEVKDLAAEAQEVVFETRGERPYPLQEFSWAVFAAGSPAKSFEFACAAARQGALVRSNEVIVDGSQAESICAKAGWPATFAKQLQEGPCIGLELDVGSSSEDLLELAKLAGAQVSTSMDAASVFRYLGVTG